MPCPPTTYRVTSGATSSSQCLACHADWSCPAGTSVPPPSRPQHVEATAGPHGGIDVNWKAPTTLVVAAPSNYTVSTDPATIELIVDGKQLFATLPAGVLRHGESYAAMVVADGARGRSSPPGRSELVTPHTECWPPCSDNGVCSAGTCECDSAWEGETCTQWATWKIALTIAGAVATLLSCAAATYKLRAALRERRQKRPRHDSDTADNGVALDVPYGQLPSHGEGKQQHEREAK